MGHPVIKPKKRKIDTMQKVLIVNSVWQRIIDDFWIIGVEIQSTTSRYVFFYLQFLTSIL